MPALTVVKVGGSLFDLPDLGGRLHRWLAASGVESALLVPGGGATANAIRQLDRCQRLGEERSHWLALQAVSLNACFLQALLPGTLIVAEPARNTPLAILDAYAFARADEVNADHLPHTWDATSDSLAARVTRASSALRLILLKSVTIPPAMDWQEAARRGWVDPLFPEVAIGLEVTCVDFRRWAPD